jgi:broad specificity phosphatase PhoE
VILVRHAMPEVVPGIAPHLWELGPEGRAAARKLAAALPAGATIVTSEEPKALQTAEEIVAVRGGTLYVDRQLREATRPTAWDDGYREQARRYVGGELLDGWEPHAAVIERFTAAARGDIVVTHGLAMTLYLGADVRFWEELTFPDAWSALAGHLRRVH